MRVLHVLAGFHSAGIESLASQLIRHAPVEFDNELLNTDISIQTMSPVFEQLLMDNRLNRLHQWSSFDGPRLAWRSLCLCRRRSIDALVLYPCNRPMLWVALGARLAGVRKLAVHLGNTVPKETEKRKAWRRLLNWFQRLGVLPVPCSEAIVNSIQSLSNSIILAPVIHNGCDSTLIKRRAQIAQSQRSNDDSFRILMVARLDTIKDQANLIRAFSRVRQPGWQLQLVGDGPERSCLERLALEKGLDPAKVFLGCRSNIPELLGQADLFAFSTTSAEGFGIALIEAMAVGLPIIASDVPACREVLCNGEAGMLLPAGDVGQWAKQLRTLMESPAKRLELAKQASVHAAYFDSSNCAKSWYRLLIS